MYMYIDMYIYIHIFAHTHARILCNSLENCLLDFGVLSLKLGDDEDVFPSAEELCFYCVRAIYLKHLMSARRFL